MSTDLTIVVPTYNERENIEPIITSVQNVLAGINWEIIFVDDDSPDGTADLVKDIAMNDSRIRCIRRINRRGLTSAAMEGLLASSATCVAVMDADLQHDETLLGQMYKLITNNEADIVIGSRYIQGGSTGQGLSPFRLFVSKAATLMGQLILKASVTDPMSGYFMLRRSTFEHQMHKLSGKGFKILLDLLSSTSKDVHVKELPYTMRQRQTGESKLDMMVISEYYLLLLDKLIGKYIPVRFLMFVTVGIIGVIVHLLVLTVLHKSMSIDFIYSQAGATLIAMTTNFVINNRFTYRDMRLTGKRFIFGLFTFYLACSVGAYINVSLSQFMFTHGINWLAAGILGAFIGSIWNYAMTATFTWNKREQC
ncbi:glycosyltransferase family 2 protein [Candidatus Pacearchaeota archaeon]|nr:glycosyltransferase family 2 protein [Candidatus Pacearchaeota archaeon]